MENAKISLIIPCYNEAENIHAFYNMVKESYKQEIKNIEFVFIDDGSSDSTFCKLQELYNRYEHIKVICFSRNFGKEAAIYAGLSHAGGKYNCIIDADLQQSPEVVKEMEELLDLNDDVDCVAAYQQVRHEGKILSVFKNCFYRMINRMTDIEFVAGASDFRMFRKNVKDAILNLQERYRFSKGIFSWIGFETAYIPYEVQERHSGNSKWSFRKLIKYGMGGIVSFTTTPLKIAMHMGGIISGASFSYLVIVIAQKLINDIKVPGYPTLVSLILLLGGVQLIMLGIIGEYLGRTYIEGKNRPIYIAKKILED